MRFALSHLVICSSLVAAVLSGTPARAQLSPPGLDGAKAVTWAAVGFSQQLSSKWTTTWYIGGSGQSDMRSYSALKKPAIFVINQETLYTFNSRWSLVGAVSFREQEVYEERAPYAAQEPPWKREIRYYLRLFYRFKAGNATGSISLRPEYRTFYTTQGDHWSSPAQQRYRFKSQINIPLNASKSNTLVLANEFLFATDENGEHQWSPLHFTEDRLSTYVRHTFRKPALFLDLGMMHQLWKDKEKQVHYTTYFALDLIFTNPFGNGRKSG